MARDHAVTPFERDALMMCEGFGSVLVEHPGGSFRGLLSEQDVEVTARGDFSSRGQSQMKRMTVLRVATCRVTELDVQHEDTITVDEDPYVIRDVRKEIGGATVLALVAT